MPKEQHPWAGAQQTQVVLRTEGQAAFALQIRCFSFTILQDFQTFQLRSCKYFLMSIFKNIPHQVAPSCLYITLAPGESCVWSLWGPTLMWELGMKLETSSETASFPNHWAISRIPIRHFLVEISDGTDMRAYRYAYMYLLKLSNCKQMVLQPMN